jgi:hypothetical protein
MTDHERDPEATGPEGAADETDDTDAAGAADDANGDSELEETEELEAAEDLGDADLEPEPEPGTGRAPAAIAAAPAARGRRQPKERPPVKVAPSVSDVAVKVHDRASAVFVIGLTTLFSVILLYGLLFGHAGFVSGLLPTPTPRPTASRS